MTKKDKIYELIVKKLTREISEEERKYLDKEISNDNVLKRSFLGLVNFWKYFFPKPKRHSIIEKTEKKLGLTYHSGRNRTIRSILKVAAIFLFIVSLGFSVYQISKPRQELALNEYGCGPGETKEVTLTDGTKVWLNSSSLLITSEPFTGKTREVKLFGEGYFEVASNPEQPFIIHTRQLKTKVLGTHFNIVAYPTDDVHEISLHEGKVKLIPDDDVNSTILKPGHKAYFSINTGDLKVITTDLGTPAKWRDGILRFYDENLFNITQKLERQFHTKIFIADSTVGNLRYTAEFEEESLERILMLLDEAEGFNYKITNNGVIIESKNK